MRAQARAESSSHPPIRSYFRNFQHKLIGLLLGIFIQPAGWQQSSKYAQDYLVTCHRLKIDIPTLSLCPSNSLLRLTMTTVIVW